MYCLIAVEGCARNQLEFEGPVRQRGHTAAVGELAVAASGIVAIELAVA